MAHVSQHHKRTLVNQGQAEFQFSDSRQVMFLASAPSGGRAARFHVIKWPCDSHPTQTAPRLRRRLLPLWWPPAAVPLNLAAQRRAAARSDSWLNSCCSFWPPTQRRLFGRTSQCAPSDASQAFCGAMRGRGAVEKVFLPRTCFAPWAGHDTRAPHVPACPPRRAHHGLHGSPGCTHHLTHPDLKGAPPARTPPRSELPELLF